MLELRNISKSFPGVRALQNVSVSFNSGEIHTICGENGAGKSTLMNLIVGNLKADDGEILINKKSVHLKEPQDAYDLGISIVYQHLSLCENLTVAENIFANRAPVNKWGFIQHDKLTHNVKSLLGELQVTISPNTIISDLAPGQKQMVEIAKALSRKPKILILDEPTASLTPNEAITFFNILKELRLNGTCIIYISHRMQEIFELADRISVLKDGKYQGTALATEISKEQLIKLMVGRDLPNLRVKSSATTDVLLEVKNLSGGRFKDINFAVRRGEILGFAGLIGSGRTEIARALFGADTIKTGQMVFQKRDIKLNHPAAGIREKIAYLPEDRKNLGLFLNMTIEDNIISANLENIVSGVVIDQIKIESTTKKYIEKLTIKSPDGKTIVSNLSGGNQQKVVLAKWLNTAPDLLIVDEPTHGIDVGSKHEIYNLLMDFTALGKTVIIISSDLPELLALCDRIIVIKNGTIASELDASQATEERILTMATG